MILFWFGVLLTLLFEIINEPLPHPHPPNSIILPLANWVVVYSLLSMVCRLNVPSNTPPLPVSIVVLAVHAVASMVWFTAWHRVFHTRMFYPLHKVHHRYKRLAPRAALYAHPIEAVIVNAGSVCVPTAVLAGWMCVRARDVVMVVAIFQAVTAHTNTRLVNNDYHQRHHKYVSTHFGLAMCPM